MASKVCRRGHAWGGASTWPRGRRHGTHRWAYYQIIKRSSI